MNNKYIKIKCFCNNSICNDKYFEKMIFVIIILMIVNIGKVKDHSDNNIYNYLIF